MNMDTQTFWTSLSIGLTTVIGVLGKIIYSNIENNVKDLQKEVHELKILVVGKYVEEGIYREDIKMIFDKLEEINNKLSGKADRRSTD